LISKKIILLHIHKNFKVKFDVFLLPIFPDITLTLKTIRVIRKRKLREKT